MYLSYGILFLLLIKLQVDLLIGFSHGKTVLKYAFNVFFCNASFQNLLILNYFVCFLWFPFPLGAFECLFKLSCLILRIIPLYIVCVMHVRLHIAIVLVILSVLHWSLIGFVQRSCSVVSVLFLFDYLLVT